jgi:hypothetical protein
VKQSENGEVRQASRAVTAARKQAVAREKVRITGKRARQPSALEQAAAEWEKEQEAKARRSEEERLRISRQVDTYPFSLEQMQLSASGTEADEDVGWKPYNAEQGNGDKKRTATIVTRRVNMAGVCALSQRLMAIERARALGRKPVDVQARALELEARRWLGERARC